MQSDYAQGFVCTIIWFGIYEPPAAPGMCPEDLRGNVRRRDGVKSWFRQNYTVLMGPNRNEKYHSRIFGTIGKKTEVQQTLLRFKVTVVVPFPSPSFALTRAAAVVISGTINRIGDEFPVMARTRCCHPVVPLLTDCIMHYRYRSWFCLASIFDFCNCTHSHYTGKKRMWSRKLVPHTTRRIELLPRSMRQHSAWMLHTRCIYTIF